MNKAKKRGKTWRVQVYDYTDPEGKKHYRSFSALTKAEAELKAAEFKARKKKRRSISEMTVREAIDKYIELRPNLSPTTLTGYNKMKRFAFQDIMDAPVEDLDDILVQEAINRESLRISERTGKQLSAKTVKNEYGLLASALRTVCKRTFIVSLPKKHRHIKDFPEIPDVQRALIGTDVELPCNLALQLTFTMSEIRGLKCSDYKDGRIKIDRVIVDTSEGAVVKANAKVEKRLRKRKPSEYLCELIENSENYQEYMRTGKDLYLVTMERGRIYRHWKAIAQRMGYDLTFHDLRHLAASTMLFLGVPQKYSMDFGGWETPDVMEDTYQEVLNAERDHFENVINDYFQSNITNYTTSQSQTC